MTRFQYEVQYFHYSYFKQVAGSINVHGSIFAQTGSPILVKRLTLFPFFFSILHHMDITILSVLLMLFVFLSVTMD